MLLAAKQICQQRTLCPTHFYAKFRRYLTCNSSSYSKAVVIAAKISGNRIMA